jgi:hypothetical protein
VGAGPIKTHIESVSENPHSQRRKARPGYRQNFVLVIYSALDQWLLRLQEAEHGDEHGELKDCAPHAFGE